MASRKKSRLSVVTMVISRLVSGVQAGRSDEQVCSRCVAVEDHTHSHEHRGRQKHKGGENTGEHGGKQAIVAMTTKRTASLTFYPSSMFCHLSVTDVSGTLRSA